MCIATNPAHLSPLQAQLPAEIADLIDDAHTYLNAARADATKRAYRSDWADFTEWTCTRGFATLPADPAAVILYIADLAKRCKPSTITRRLSSISIAHQDAGLPSPTTDQHVRDVVRGIRRTLGTAQREAAPATIAEIRRMVWSLGDSVLDTRDRALLLVGFAGALRRSELVALDVGDLEDRAEGLTAMIRRSKTDQEGEGRRIALPFGIDPMTCPVRALQKWTEVAGVAEGAIFRPVNRGGRVGTSRLTDQTVGLVVKRCASLAGLDATRFSGHSLRAGFATTAAAAGANERAICNQTGHRSTAVLRRYVRHGTVFIDNAVGQVGL